MTMAAVAQKSEIQQGRVLNAEHWAFEFLVDHGGAREVFDGLELTVVSYRMEHGGSFEIELDWNDGLATVLLCDDPDEWPGAGIMSRDGRPVRRSFTRALTLAGIPSEDLQRRCREVPLEWGTQRVLGLLDANAKALRPHVTSIVEAWSTIFAAPSTTV